MCRNGGKLATLTSFTPRDGVEFLLFAPEPNRPPPCTMPICRTGACARPRNSSASSSSFGKGRDREAASLTAYLSFPATSWTLKAFLDLDLPPAIDQTRRAEILNRRRGWLRGFGVRHGGQIL